MNLYTVGKDVDTLEVAVLDQGIQVHGMENAKKVTILLRKMVPENEIEDMICPDCGNFKDPKKVELPNCGCLERIGEAIKSPTKE